ncbi:hypothetical protein IWW56_001623 [Coemansia sp. RSA 2131]|nr:hypothetical protein IWW56_001623 [Coemansia sp. RSA 2131]
MRYSLGLRLLFALLVAMMFQPQSARTQSSLSKRLNFDINITTPAFLIRIPFTINSGASSISGHIRIYYQASRSVKVVANAGQMYEARISMTTFMFFMQYTESSWGVTHQAQDIVYLSKVEADIMSAGASHFIAIS